MNGSRLKILAIGKIGLVPKYTPNPRVLGTVWSSYGEATPTQESPRNKQDPARKRTPKDSERNSKTRHGITHRLIRCTDLNSVGSTDEQSRQQSESEHRLIRRMALNSVGSTGVTHRMIRQNQTPTLVQLSRGITKLKFNAPVKPTKSKPLRRFNCPENQHIKSH